MVSIVATASLALLTNAYPGLAAAFSKPSAVAIPADHRAAGQAVRPEEHVGLLTAARPQGVTWFGQTIETAPGLFPASGAEPLEGAGRNAATQARRKPRVAQTAARRERTGAIPEILPAPRPGQAADAPVRESGPKPTLLGMPLPGLQAGEAIFHGAASLGGVLVERITP